MSAAPVDAADAASLDAVPRLLPDDTATVQTSIAGDSVSTTVELACSRCLEGFRVPMDPSFDLLFLPATAEPHATEQEVEDDDLGTSYYRDGVIDLADVVREQLSLALPMKPLCQETCKGLCPECGTNLNTGACDCTHRWDDPRLAPLKALTRTNDDA